ncbi:PREDICTED: mushroom body large-type Kenyon cell-specific protein 1-like [Diuraphis noxia]|uniref:mushroom body large-type Kenyon cell-specific protein 1-like n=1 Tax=Diuraphis noxia TaxID=143948 RepID=UPI0007639BB6|nr:PREDICTED: mushroom body large-type Kenyon cell-specific protein 1-like [Diuraphis noxia]
MYVVELPTGIFCNNIIDPHGTSKRSRGKKIKPAKMAMMMAGTAAASMLMMKAIAAIKLFIIHSFFATKLGLVVGAYLLVCKLMEMKQTSAKKSVQVKWVSAPPNFDEHLPQMPPMMSHYPDAGQSTYEPQQEQQQQHQQPYQQPSDQYGPPPQQQQYMSSGDFNGGSDLQAHYSHVSPVTYRPVMVTRNQSDNNAKSAAARVKS